MYNYYIMPKLVKTDDNNYVKNYHTYTHYNYLSGGFTGYIKRLHFNIALKMAEPYFNHNAYDIGCADGPLLPSLSKYFNYVIGVDINKNFLNIADKLITEMQLNNVELRLSDDILYTKNKDYKVVFLLEILEHIGDKNRLYESRMDFISNMFQLIDDDGITIISVPKMTGPSYIIQYMALRILGKNAEKISLSNLLKASFLYDTKDLEKQWVNGHLGFNNRIFEKFLKKNFVILEKKDLIFQVVYKIKKQ